MIFFLLANAAYRYQWNEDIGESEITEILYVLRDCRMDGNTSLRLVSIKKAEDLEKNTRITREVGVLSWESGVTLREFADSNVFMDKGIDLSRLNITADQALALVEEQMGDEILTSLKKRCAIISINMDNDKPLTWKINFTDADLNHFYIYVDAKSGEIREKE